MLSFLNASVQVKSTDNIRKTENSSLSMYLLDPEQK
jgi:hypothetical protein